MLKSKLYVMKIFDFIQQLSICYNITITIIDNSQVEIGSTAICIANNYQEAYDFYNQIPTQGNSGNRIEKKIDESCQNASSYFALIDIQYIDAVQKSIEKAQKLMNKKS